MCIELGINFIKPSLDNKTRWLSLYYMLEKLKYLRTAFDKLVAIKYENKEKRLKAN